MPVPWVQIVQLMPSIIEMSRELLKRSRRAGPAAPALPSAPAAEAPLEARILALEENERRQAELVSNMADQLAQLTAVATSLHKQVRRLVAGQAAALVIALIAMLVALR